MARLFLEYNRIETVRCCKEAPNLKVHSSHACYSLNSSYSSAFKPNIHDCEINGKAAKFLVDTASTHDLVDKRVVKDQFYTGKVIKITNVLCSDVYSLPVARIKLSFENKVVFKEMIVSAFLPKGIKCLLTDKSFKCFTDCDTEKPSCKNVPKGKVFRSKKKFKQSSTASVKGDCQPIVPSRKEEVTDLKHMRPEISDGPSFCNPKGMKPNRRFRARSKRKRPAQPKVLSEKLWSITLKRKTLFLFLVLN